MQKRFCPGRVLSLSVLLLVFAPWLRSQQVDEKNPPEAGASEQKTHEHVNGPCDLTACPARFFYLSNIAQPNELQDFVNALRTIAEISRIQQIPSEQLVIVRGTPEQLALAEKLEDEIDRDKRRFGGIGYRLDFKLTQSEGEKKVRSHVYSIVTEGRESAKLGIGRAQPAASPREAPPESKPLPEAAPRQSIECRVLAENERTIDLTVEADFSPSGARETGKVVESPDPTQWRFKDRAVLELGKPTVIGMVDDPDRERAFQLEVTATRLKERQ